MKEVAKKHPAKHIILAVAIAIVTVFFVAYAIQSFYPSPKYEDFCEERLTFKAIETQEECETNEGRWTGNFEREDIQALPTVEDLKNGWCDTTYFCREEYDATKDAYERNVFFVNIVIGIAIIILSFLLALEAVSSGLMGGGALLLIYSSIRYWGNLSNIWRTIMLGFTLVILVVIGYKKLK
jgi:hypothetical protein